MPNIYIIAGCNGAGKTTASFTVLPEMLNCDVFINADEIARGLSPLNPEKAVIEAGRIMLSKIDKLISDKKDFAFETTLSTKSYTNYIERARQNGFIVTLIFFWLDSVELAIDRVQTRVREGGHDVLHEILQRRYYRGLKNLFNLYIPKCDYWMIFNNSTSPSTLVAEGYSDKEIFINKTSIFETIKQLAKYDQKR